MTSLAALAGTGLGEHTVAYQPRDAILYALAVGAPPERLDLVYERDLRVLPTLAAALGLWAVEAAGTLGAYDPQRSLHAAQRLQMHRALRSEETITTRGEIAAVWDKGKAAVVEITVESEAFSAGYSIFLPGMGGWGGDRGPSRTARQLSPTWRSSYATSPSQAVLYRLTGDAHPIHIDRDVAAQNGFARPILHGLCTLGIAVMQVSEAVGAHPADLRELDCRLTASVLPGDTIDLLAEPVGARDARFEARSGDAVAIAGHVTF